MTSRTAAVASAAAALAAVIAALPTAFPAAPPAPLPPRLDLNAASARELDLLPGVGPKTAERIVADRSSRGRFASPGEIRRVKGVTRRAAQRIATLTEAR
ncbi:MAG: helix-hairpin-helix domain-containing protein [Planctomycetes bacterium]|nr:helix-hairpin-helix domain-containing protein [Planctomycetota bacterium]